MRNKFLLLCFLLSLVSLSSCKRDMFDAEAYEEMLNESAPFTEIDANHTWNLTKSHNVQVKMGYETDVQCVQILNGNPNEQSNVEILAEQTVEPGEQKGIFFYAPTYLTDFFAAIVKKDGSYKMKSFAAGQQVVDMSMGLFFQGTNFRTPDYQAYTYCYEEDYPRPSEDWDFNDLVLRIQKIPGKEANEVRLKITLAAVGATKQLAAAVRLVGCRYDDVESVTVEGGRTFDNFNNAEFTQKRIFIDRADLLLRGEKGEAVLNLFEDAHWVMSSRLSLDGTGVVRMFYNTQFGKPTTTSAQVAPKTLTYVIKFKNPQQLGNFTLESLDPFIIEDFNSGRWEVHTYDYKADGVLYDYGSNETAWSNNMVWALKIPSGAFRWPLEGTSIGYYKGGILTGAYMKMNHSFGQWVENCNVSLDWFCYPAAGMIY